MIKARGTGADGAPVYLLGLSDGNIERLRKKQPMLINLREIGGDGHVVIIWGPTEEAMRDDVLRNCSVGNLKDFKTPNG